MGLGRSTWFHSVALLLGFESLVLGFLSGWNSFGARHGRVLRAGHYPHRLFDKYIAFLLLEMSDFSGEPSASTRDAARFSLVEWEIIRAGYFISRLIWKFRRREAKWSFFFVSGPFLLFVACAPLNVGGPPSWVSAAVGRQPPGKWRHRPNNSSIPRNGQTGRRSCSLCCFRGAQMRLVARRCSESNSHPHLGTAL